MDTTQSFRHPTIEELRAFVAQTRSRVLPERTADLLARQVESLYPAGQGLDVLLPLITDLRRRIAERGEERAERRDGSELPLRTREKDQHMLGSLAILLSESARAHLARRDLAEASREIEESLRIARDLQIDHRVGVGLLIEADLAASIGEMERVAPLLEEAERIAIAEEDPGLLAATQIRCAALFEARGDHARGVALCTEVIRRSGELPIDRQLRGRAYHQRALLQRGSDPEGALLSVGRALDLLDVERGWDEDPLVILQAELSLLSGQYRDAFEATSRYLERYAQKEMSVERGRIHRLLGIFHERFEEHEEALDHYRRGAAVFAECGETREEIGIKIYLAALLRRLDRNGEAADLCGGLLARRASVMEGAGEHYPDILLILGNIFEEEGDHREATRHYLAGLDLADRKADPRRYAVLLIALGRLGGAAGNTEEAIDRLREGIELLPKAGDQQSRVEAERLLADLFRHRGQESSAITHLENVIDLLERRSAGLLDERLNRLRMERHVDDLRGELMEREDLRHDLEEVVTDLRSELIELRTLIEKIAEHLRSGVPLPVSTLRMIEEQSRGLSQERGEKLDGFGRWYAVLRERHPDLTPGQLRLCELIRSGRDGQEIAEALHITRDSLTKRRYRLRKGLGISGTTSLEHYLLTLGTESSSSAESSTSTTAL